MVLGQIMAVLPKIRIMTKFIYILYTYYLNNLLCDKMPKDLEKYNNYFKYLLLIFFVFKLYIMTTFFNHGFYDVFVSIVAMFLIFVPELFRYVFRIRFPEFVRLFWYVMLLLGLYGETLLSYTNWYDKILHTFTGYLFFMLGIVLLIVRFGEPKVSNNLGKAFIYSFFLMFLLQLVWELIESLSDFYFGTRMTQLGFVDTLLDVLCDFIGATIAAIVTYFHFRKGNESRNIKWWVSDLKALGKDK